VEASSRDAAEACSRDAAEAQHHGRARASTLSGRKFRKPLRSSR
jgi:hypothetical protein